MDVHEEDDSDTWLSLQVSKSFTYFDHYIALSRLTDFTLTGQTFKN